MNIIKVQSSNENDLDKEVIDIICQDVSELSKDELIRLQEQYHCRHIMLEDQCLGIKDNAPYTVQEYLLCQERIDELIKNVIVPPEGTKNREKIIWGQVVKILADNIKYNQQYARDYSLLNNQIKEMQEKYSKEELQNNDEYHSLQEKQKNMVDSKNYNMVGGLLYGECTCSGFTEIVRNVFSRFGIEVANAKGIRENVSIGHAWNQIKLDGEWFNMDIVSEREAIIDQMDYEINLCGYLLMSDDDFNKGMEWVSGSDFSEEEREGHGVYSKNRVSPHECHRTIPCEEWMEYLYPEEIEGTPYFEWKEQQKNTVSLSSVKQAVVKHHQVEPTRPSFNGVLE